MQNRLLSEQTARLNQSVTVLGIEISGIAAKQELILGNSVTLNGRNEVRIGENGSVELAGATLESRRWIDIFEGGELRGAGAVIGDVFNAGKIAPGTDAAPATPPPSGDFSIAADFSDIDDRPDKDEFYTPLVSQTEQATFVLDYGPSTNSVLTIEVPMTFRKNLT